MVFERCTPCHRPDHPTPLPLLGYHDVRSRAGQLLVSMQRRTMPPWLPVPEGPELLNTKALRPDQIAMFQQWIEDGFPEGALQPPPVPTFPSGWQLGEPDLVVRAPQPYTLKPGGADVVRTLVVPVPVSSTRYVRAMELQPDNPRILRHALVGVDRTSRARALDAGDREPGYPGMWFDHIGGPRDRLSVWVPGGAPWAESDGMAWRLEPGSDLVLQLHMRPTRATESIQPSLGLFFSSTPPVDDPILITLESRAIDIPAGSRDRAVSDSYVLPADVHLLSVYPHAHHVAKEMKSTATLPDGTEQSLLRIKEWDPYWAEQYRYRRPLDLPRGTTLKVEYLYDNSNTNVRNPRYPPARTRWGRKTSDEMGVLWLQVLPRNRADADLLLEDARVRAQRAGGVGRQ